MGLNKLKVSFCIVCMDRTHHLKQTLLRNIMDNLEYGNFEIVLLDYNSSDGLGDLIKGSFFEYIECGILKYYRTTTPVYFNRSHSRNLAIKLASGDIVCNLDADNFTGEGFAFYVNNVFSSHRGIFLSALGSGLANDFLGRICLRKDDFMRIRGYDERMVNYGFEDYDLVGRLETMGLEKMIFSEKECIFSAVHHQQDERISKEFHYSNLELLLIGYLTPYSSEIIFIYKDETFVRLLYADNEYYPFSKGISKLQLSQLKYGFSILEDTMFSGKWHQTGTEIVLVRFDRNLLSITQDSDQSYITNNNHKLYRISDRDIISYCLMIISQIPNRIIMDQNEIDQRTIVNEVSFGRDAVYLNFSPFAVNFM
jgi:glycosyltransferase involved in cell wall biosynthesis